MDANDDLHLSIPLDPLKESFSCPICMCLFNVTTLTACGHRYCEGCILEWIDRKRKCPCCNAPVKMSDLIRDTGYDSLIQIVVTQKNKAEEAYFSDLIKKCKAEDPTLAIEEPAPIASGESAPGEGEEGEGKMDIAEAGEQQPAKPKPPPEMSPVERILQKHIRLGIIEHERYYRTLKGRFQKEFEKTKKAIQNLEGTEDETSEAERAVLVLKKRTLQAEFQKCSKLLTCAYDRYLRQHLPTLNTLPVTVYVRLFGKEVVVGDMVLDPHVSMAGLKEMIFLKVRERKDRIAVYREENVHYLLVRPYSKGHLDVDEALVFALLSREDPHSCDPDDLVCLLRPDSIPVLEYGIQPGSDIVIFGDIKLRSELPKPCFTALFEEGEDKMDYFTCKDCSFNWVCRSCKDHCHKDHETIPYVMGHQPTWACCYCPRKKKCLLRDPGN